MTTRSTASPFGFAAAALLLALTSCGDEPTPNETPPPPPPPSAQCAAGQTACGALCCAANEQCNAAKLACEAPTTTPPEQQSQLARCYTRARFDSAAFASGPAYQVDQDGYEYTASDESDAPYGQMLSVALWPLSSTTKLTGTFDLSKEPFDYARCEHCVLVIAGKSVDDQKYYLARAGTLAVSEVTNKRIAGSLADAHLVEVKIDENTLATTLVDGGCAVDIPSLSFTYQKSDQPPDDRIAQCFLPETFGPDTFRDFIYELEANDAGWFYRAIEMPDAAGIPNLTLFVEVYRAGTGSFSLAGAETNCAECYHSVIIEAKAVSGAQKNYVSASGTLVLTELSDAAMVGRLENVTLVETEISNGQFTPVVGGCSASIARLEFSSRNATSF